MGEEGAWRVLSYTVPVVSRSMACRFLSYAIVADQKTQAVAAATGVQVHTGISVVSTNYYDKRHSSCLVEECRSVI